MKSACLLTGSRTAIYAIVGKRRGALDSHARGLQRARQILSRPNPAAFPAELDARIRAEFPGLVPGEATLPEGW